MDSSSIGQTSQATLELLEARLRRVEHLLYGGSSAEPGAVPTTFTATPTVESLADLERRFASLVSNVRVYAELLKICRYRGGTTGAGLPGAGTTR